MENAVKGLEIAFAVFVFVIALTTIMFMVGEVRASSDTVFAQVNSQEFYVDVELPEDETENGKIKYNGRIVNVETIIPTLYRDYKENFVIEFYNTSEEKIMRFDLSQENRTRQIWTGNPEIDVKERLDLFINGGTSGIINNQAHFIETDIAFKNGEEYLPGAKSNVRQAIATNGLYDYLQDKKFVEEFAFVSEEVTIITERTSKIIIRYYEVL